MEGAIEELELIHNKSPHTTTPFNAAFEQPESQCSQSTANNLQDLEYNTIILFRPGISPNSSTHAAQNMSKQPENVSHSLKTTHITTQSESLQHSSHITNTTLTLSEQPGYSPQSANSFQAISELPGYSLRSDEPFYHEIADEQSNELSNFRHHDFASTSVVQEHPVQLPRRAYENRLR